MAGVPPAARSRRDSPSPQRISTWKANAARIAKPHSRVRAISIRVLTQATLAATGHVA